MAEQSSALLPLAVLGGLALLLVGTGGSRSATREPNTGPPPPPGPLPAPAPTPAPVLGPSPRIIPPLDRTGYASDGSPVLGSPQMQGQLLSTQDNEIGQAAPNPDRVKRLRNDETFRKTYAFQSLVNSMYLTNELPDGLFGPMTQRMVTAVERIVGRRLTPDTVIRATAEIAKQRLDQRQLPAVDLRMNFEWLPFDVVQLMNSAIISPFTRDRYAPIQSFYERGFPYTGLG